jgi:SNF2 family DNA or RNA helicase
VDLYGLIRFGHFRPWNDWQSFYEHIVRHSLAHSMSVVIQTDYLYAAQAKIQRQDALLASARAQGILKPILLRRTKDSKLEGKPLLSLPPKSIELEMLQFSADEREVHPLYSSIHGTPR